MICHKHKWHHPFECIYCIELEKRRITGGYKELDEYINRLKEREKR